IHRYPQAKAAPRPLLRFLLPTGEWRNWQTRRIQVPASLTGRGGSTPPSPTSRSSWRRTSLPSGSGTRGPRTWRHLGPTRRGREGARMPAVPVKKKVEDADVGARGGHLMNPAEEVVIQLLGRRGLDGVG